MTDQVDQMEQGPDVLAEAVPNVDQDERRLNITAEYESGRNQWILCVYGIAIKYFALSIGSIIVVCILLQYNSLVNLLFAIFITCLYSAFSISFAKCTSV